MSTILVTVASGSHVTGAYTDDKEIKDILIKEGDNDPTRMSVNWQPDLVTEEEAKCLITSDRLAELEAEAAAEAEEDAQAEQDQCAEMSQTDAA